MQSFQCLNCVHYMGAFEDGMYCKAFPPENKKPIPEEIITGIYDHSKPFEGDNGIRYKSSGMVDFVDYQGQSNPMSVMVFINASLIFGGT